MNDIDQLIKSIDPAPRTPVQGPGARELRVLIMAAEKPARSRKRWKVWAVAVPALAVAAAVGIGVLPPATPVGPVPASAALDFRQDGDDIVVTVRDLQAQPEKYAEEFKARGFDIKLESVPASPSLVGKWLGGRALNAPQEGPHIGLSSYGPDEMSLTIPAGYRGSDTLLFGREPQSGEKYRSTGWIAAKSEVLNCVLYIDMTVEEIAAKLRDKGVAVESYRVAEKGKPKEERRTVPGDWRVAEVILVSPTAAVIWAGPDRQQVLPALAQEYQGMLEDCRKG